MRSPARVEPPNAEVHHALSASIATLNCAMRDVLERIQELPAPVGASKSEHSKFRAACRERIARFVFGFDAFDLEVAQYYARKGGS